MFFPRVLILICPKQAMGGLDLVVG